MYIYIFYFIYIYIMFYYNWIKIIDIFQVLTAASKASLLNYQNKLKTNNVNSEIIYSLSPNTRVI